MKNVSLEKPVKRNELIKIYKESHFLFIHLNNYRAFEKVLPSKIFEYGATNKTIIAGVGGYAKEFIKENVENCIVFKSGDVEGLVEMLQNHQPLPSERKDFMAKYSREKTIVNMAISILNLAVSKKCDKI